MATVYVIRQRVRTDTTLNFDEVDTDGAAPESQENKGPARTFIANVLITRTISVSILLVA